MHTLFVLKMSTTILKTCLGDFDQVLLNLIFSAGHPTISLHKVWHPRGRWLGPGGHETLVIAIIS